VPEFLRQYENSRERHLEPNLAELGAWRARMRIRYPRCGENFVVWKTATYFEYDCKKSGSRPRNPNWISMLLV
jgi:hypothetical protein